MTKPIDTDAIRFEADAEIQICQRSGQSAHPSVYLARTLSYEIDRLRADVARRVEEVAQYRAIRLSDLAVADELRADVAAMLPIVEEVGTWNPEDCPGHDAPRPCPIESARAFLDARKVGP